MFSVFIMLSIKPRLCVWDSIVKVGLCRVIIMDLNPNFGGQLVLNH